MPPEINLTDEEREAIRTAGQLYTYIADNIVTNGPNRDNDLIELRFYIHGIQHMLMAQAASSAYPTEYRVLGETVLTRRI